MSNSSWKKIMFAAVYISINQKIEDIISFLHHQLLPYSHGGAAILGNENDKIPLVLGGDFNINFAVDDSKPLINFLEEKFSLQLNNNPNTPTTNSGTTIDAIFTRYLDNVETRTYVAYFTYHNALVTIIPIQTTSNNVNIEEIN
ncbi:ATP-dependent DNA helicase [Trichonephila clavipes]|nr:ATP-dependent DNA helicase [Trichonephila clavipes]